MYTNYLYTQDNLHAQDNLYAQDTSCRPTLITCTLTCTQLGIHCAELALLIQTIDY